MAKIYVASSWRNPYYEDVVKRLRKEGLPVYDFRNPPHGGGGFHWTDVDENAPNWSFREYADGLRHPLAGADGLVLGSPVYFGDITAQMRIGRHQSRRNRTPRGAYNLLIIIIFFSYFVFYMHR